MSFSALTGNDVKHCKSDEIVPGERMAVAHAWNIDAVVRAE